MNVPELHLIATAFMAGVIVFVQIVHYPLMASVGEASFVEYERGHTVRTGWVVVPAMVTELATAALLVAAPAQTGVNAVAWVGLGLLGVVWTSTALLQAPAHGRMIEGFDATVHRRLVATNWIRTIAWLARLPIAVMLLPG